MITYNYNLRNRQVQALVGAFEPPGDAKLRLYDGTLPASPDDPVTTQTLLAELDLPDDAFANPTLGVVRRGDEWEGVGLAAGTATWFRLVSGTYVLQGTVSAADGGGSLIITRPTIVVGETVSASLVTISHP